RVVGDSRVLRDLDGRRAGELVGLSGDEALEREGLVEPGALELGRRLGGRPRRHGSAARRRLGRGLREHELQAALAPARLGGETLDARGEPFPDELEHEPVGCREHERLLAFRRLRRERSDPGIELLRGKFLLELTQAGVPEVLHSLKRPWWWGLEGKHFTRLAQGYPQAPPAASHAGVR